MGFDVLFSVLVSGCWFTGFTCFLGFVLSWLAVSWVLFGAFRLGVVVFGMECLC